MTGSSNKSAIASNNIDQKIIDKAMSELDLSKDEVKKTTIDVTYKEQSEYASKSFDFEKMIAP